MSVPTVFAIRSRGVPAAAAACRSAHGPSEDETAEYDNVVICAGGDLRTLLAVFGDVQGVESVGLFVDQLRLVVRRGRGVLCRLVELAEAADVNITLVAVVPQER